MLRATDEAKANPEELEHLKSDIRRSIHLINEDEDYRPPAVTQDSTKQLDINSSYGILALLVGTLMYGMVGVLTRLSMMEQDPPPFNTNAVLLCTDIAKFAVTISVLLHLHGFSGTVKLTQAIPFKEWFLFSIPAIIYSITNNLEFYILRYMDPGTLSVLVQSKIITTAVCWWLAFKNTIDKQQWVALSLLCLGSMLVAWPSSENHGKTMYIIWPYGPLLVLLQVCLSPLAGIYTEFVYKTFGKGRSMHIDNLSMYLWGMIANGLQFYLLDENASLNLLKGFNVYTYLVVIVVTALGLCIGFVMKYFNNIIKLLMSGAAIVVSGVLTFFVFSLSWTLSYCVGAVVVITAVLLFKSQRKFI